MFASWRFVILKKDPLKSSLGPTQLVNSVAQKHFVSGVPAKAKGLSRLAIRNTRVL